MARAHAQASRFGLVAAIVAVLLMFGVGTLVIAQNEQPPRDPSQRPGQTQSNQQNQRDTDKPSALMQQHVLANDLMGTTVRNNQNEELGEISDIVFDANHQQVQYVVMASGGFLGIGGDKHAIPWEMVTPRLSENHVSVPISKDVLDETPGFGDEWPRSRTDAGVISMADASQGATRMPGDVERRGVPPSGSTTGRGPEWDGSGMGTPGEASEQAFEMRKASNLIGINLQLSATDPSAMSDQRFRGDMDRDDDMGDATPGRADRQGDDESGVYDDDAGTEDGRTGTVDRDVDIVVGENAGTIDDLLLSNEGRLEMAIIQPNTDYFDNLEDDQLVALPWTRIDVVPTQELAMASMSKSEAQNLTIRDNELNRLDDNQFRSNFYSSIGESMGSSPLSQSNGNLGRVERDGEMNGHTNGRKAQQSGQQDMQKWSSFADQCLGANFDKADQTINGTVHNVGTMYTGQDAEAPDGLRFIVRTDNNERVSVYAGPRNQVASSLNLYRGDQVTIKGTRCEIEDDEVFVATSIQTNGTEYTLTEKNGVPQWSTNGKQKNGDEKKQQKEQKSKSETEGR